MNDTLRCVVITVSSSRAAGSGEEDRSGDLVASRLAALPARVVGRTVVADDVAAIRNAVTAAADAELIVLTGGTGIADGDVTPEAVRPLLERKIPGMVEAMRSAGMASTPHAMLSRQQAGLVGHALLLALPGSARACGECLDAVWDALPHALELLAANPANTLRRTGNG
jgi:molybdenum cofactor synthesis domain-containing protein